LEGDGNNGSVWEFYLAAMSNNYQQTDIRTKMIHKGKKQGDLLPKKADYRSMWACKEQ